MRFTADGPSLPDDLLFSRDLGDVVFFCGAGVSRAQADLPDFRGLADQVIGELGAALDSPARRTDLAVDRVFRLLEREFEVREVRDAVATHLDGGIAPPLGAHRTLLDLATSRAGVTRLVTTNFDTLFEQARPELAWSSPPRLPDPHNDLDFRGIVHIHGRVAAAGPAPPELVLSSADFGRAYMSDGWATRFIRRLLDRFQVVFVGYSAEDPPVQYLLEALDLPLGTRKKLYTLENADDGQAIGLWEHKGVEAIPYRGGFPVLWETLDRWAERARDPDGWSDAVVQRGTDGPAALSPHERGQVAHILGSAEGARRMISGANPLPAAWLNVLDPSGRYETPATSYHEPTAPTFDPFAAFGLDTDASPPPTDPSDYYKRREIPADAWDGFAASRTDRRDPVRQTLAGPGADTPMGMPGRLNTLGTWIRNIAHQPGTLLWAVRRGRLHPHVLQQIDWALRSEVRRFDPIVLDGWRWFALSLEDEARDANRVDYDLRARVAAEGWSQRLVRAWCAMFRPRLTVNPGQSVSAGPIDVPERLGDLIRLDVDFPRPHREQPPADDLVAYTVQCFRDNLDLAVALERDVRGRSGLYLTPSRGPAGDLVAGDTFGATGVLATFQRLFARLAALDPIRARAEAASWPSDDEHLFARLRIWALGLPDLFPGETAVAGFLTLSDTIFWGSAHQRDLLFALRDRWADLPADGRRALETRILTGTAPYDDADDVAGRYAAYHQLNRIFWLSQEGVTFGFDIEAEIALRRAIDTDWSTDVAAEAIEANTGEVYSITRDTDPAPLAAVPLNAVFAASQQAGGLRIRDRVHRDPFAGLSGTEPLRALGALTLAGKADGAPPWAWGDFLRSGTRGRDRDRLFQTVALRLARLPTDQLAAIAHPASEWMHANAARLHALPALAQGLWAALVDAQRANPPADIPRRPGKAWADEALNAPVGNLFQFLMADPAREALGAGKGLPLEMAARIEDLLALPGELRGQTVVMAGFHTSWFFYIDSDWTGRVVLPLMDCANPDADPFWEGFLWRAHAPSPPLLTLMKNALVQEAMVATASRRHDRNLGGMLLHAWGRGLDPDNAEASLTSVEFREVLIHANEDLRRDVLWTLGRWTADAGDVWSDRAAAFLQNVWPRQRSMRTPSLSERLAELVLAVPTRFTILVPLVLPRLVPVRRYGSPLDGLDDPETGPLIERHPVEVLDLIWALLGEDTDDWPYGIAETLERLAAQPAVESDTRLSELRRRLQQ